MKFYPVALGLLLLTPSTSAEALSTIRARSGATAQVASASAGKFQCLVNHLEKAGVKIKFMGGWRRHGSVSGSLHPSGRALDVNQHSRNRTSPHVPVSVGNAAAAACGLIHGAVWRNADAGHFQDGGWGGEASARKRKHYRRR